MVLLLAYESILQDPSRSVGAERKDRIFTLLGLFAQQSQEATFKDLQSTGAFSALLARAVFYESSDYKPPPVPEDEGSFAFRKKV